MGNSEADWDLHLGLAGLGGQLDAFEGALQVGLGLLGVGVQVELDDQDREPRRRGRLDGLDLGHPVYGVLDGLGDLLVHELGSGPRHRRRDDDDGE